MTYGSVVTVSNPYAPTTVANCTFANNTGDSDGALLIVGEAYLYDNIFWNPDLAHEIITESSNNLQVDPVIHAAYNDIRGGRDNIRVIGDDIVIDWQEGNIDQDPLFVGGEPFDYRLSMYSPCIGAGLPDTTGFGIPGYDLAGNARVINGRADMGCYEYTGTGTGDDNAPRPDGVALRSYPNPLRLGNGDTRGNTRAIIEFTLLEPLKQRADVEIYNVRGQKMRTLEVTTNLYALARKAGKDTLGKYAPNAYSTMWDGHDDNHRHVSTGVYFYRLVADGKPMATGKMMVLK